jgi:Arc/MetJ-type ribon-helix-helix transcriptional regulator
MSSKERLSASVDSTLIRAAEAAVKRGVAPSVSAWVNDALRLKLAQEQRLEALASFISAYEKENGEITSDEIRLAARRARAKAVTVRALPEASNPRRKNSR